MERKESINPAFLYTYRYIVLDKEGIQSEKYESITVPLNLPSNEVKDHISKQDQSIVKMFEDSGYKVLNK